MNVCIQNRMVHQRQNGAITVVSAVLILILLTLMLVYTAQTGLFEQRKSSNDMRQKLAFHVADSAIQEAKQFMQANSVLISSAEVDLLNGTEDGWLAPTGELRWLPCNTVTDQTHPCFAESNPSLRSDSYYYYFGGSNELPLSPATVSNTERVSLHALLCMLDIDFTKDPVVQGCTTVSAEQDDKYFIVTLAARGEADCQSDGTACQAEALVSDKIASSGPGAGEGGQGVPLMTRTAVPLLGTVEIVPNPNGGGIGVPISTWANANASCPTVGDPIDPTSGSFSTCELHEFYGVDDFPSDYKCPTSNCACSKNDDKLLSYSQGAEKILGIDIVIDENFPCDIFAYLFGVEKTNYTRVRDTVPAINRLSDCDSLDENSFGIYWISGSDCDITSNVTVGSASHPVLLISAAAQTTIHGSLFGVLVVTDAENAAAEFSGNGHGTIYGAAVMDAEMNHFNGTFQIVYLDNVVQKTFGTGVFGALQGGWTDIHADWQ